ncbi:ribonuclease H-like domain-containing protein [Tanacetum coccineum]
MDSLMFPRLVVTLLRVSILLDISNNNNSNLLTWHLCSTSCLFSSRNKTQINIWIQVLVLTCSSIQDLKTRAFIQRCNSVGDLYPVLPCFSRMTPATSLAAVSSDTWHRRLGHPSSSIFNFNFLHSRKFIYCPNKVYDVFADSDDTHGLSLSLDPTHTSVPSRVDPIVIESSGATNRATPGPSESRSVLPPEFGSPQPFLSSELLSEPIVSNRTSSSSTSQPSPTRTHPMTTWSQTGSLKSVERLSLSACTVESPLPRSTAQAMCDPNWKAAMDSEMSALLSNHTWDLVPHPSHVNIGSQQPGIDFDENFSPVVKPVTIRTALSIAISGYWPIHQLDVKNAFLNGDHTGGVC